MWFQPIDSRPGEDAIINHYYFMSLKWICGCLQQGKCKPALTVLLGNDEQAGTWKMPNVFSSQPAPLADLKRLAGVKICIILESTPWWGKVWLYALSDLLEVVCFIQKCSLSPILLLKVKYNAVTWADDPGFTCVAHLLPNASLSVES